MPIETLNPSTGKPLKQYSLMSDADIEQLIEKVHQDYLNWSTQSFDHRKKCMLSISQLLKKKKVMLANLMADEMGKPITAGIAEIEKCSLVCEYYAKNAEKMLEPKVVATDLQKSFVVFEPMGIVFAVMPWNYPFWQVFRFAAPNLMAGNGCLLKHASISTGSALEIEKLFQEAGFPENIFRTLVINSASVSKVIANPHIIAVTLTGSENAGIDVAAAASKELKHAVLELGGSDPYLILKDADLSHAAKICVASRLANSGQVCISAKRIIVVADVYEDFKNKVISEMSHYVMGDPHENTTLLGPLAREDLRQTVQEQVQRSVAKGAKLIQGGEIPQGAGFFYPPTLLTEVTAGMPAFDEEIFGPVVTLIRVQDEEEGITLANQTEYGLGAAVFTQNISKGEYLARYKLNAGTCAVNTAVHSDPRLPFGGIKRSGFGRELGEYGLKSFLNIKTIQIY